MVHLLSTETPCQTEEVDCIKALSCVSLWETLATLPLGRGRKIALVTRAQYWFVQSVEKRSRPRFCRMSWL
jgi:hypothetical protein